MPAETVQERTCPEENQGKKIRLAGSPLAWSPSPGLLCCPHRTNASLPGQVEPVLRLAQRAPSTPVHSAGACADALPVLLRTELFCSPASALHPPLLSQINAVTF